MATKISPVTLVALAKHYTRASADSKIKPGSHTIDEEVSLRVVGTIDVKPDTEAKPPLRIPIAHVLAVLLGNIERYRPELGQPLREDMQRALKECAATPELIEKNYPAELVVTKDMVIEAEDYHKEHVDAKPRKGAKSFHGEVTVVN